MSLLFLGISAVVIPGFTIGSGYGRLVTRSLRGVVGVPGFSLRQHFSVSPESLPADSKYRELAEPIWILWYHGVEYSGLWAPVERRTSETLRLRSTDISWWDTLPMDPEVRQVALDAVGAELKSIRPDRRLLCAETVNSVHGLWWGYVWNAASAAAVIVLIRETSCALSRCRTRWRQRSTPTDP